MKNKKKLADYLELPYTIQIRPIQDESGSYYYVSVAELEGCQSDGQTLEEAYQNIREAMEGYLEVKLEREILFRCPNME